jgi:putative PEP-CTERM system histidine kinase
MTTWITSHAAAGVAFAVLTALLLANSRRQGVALSLVVAACASSVWGFALALAPATPLRAGSFISAAEALRIAGWTLFLFHLVVKVHGRSPTTTALAALAAVLVVCAALAPFTPTLLPAPSQLLLPMIYVALATIGIILLENLLRNADEDARWRLKFLCIAIGGLLGYDIVLSADGLLFGRYSELLSEPRGIVNAMAVPLIAIAAARNPEWEASLHVSRRVVFQTATLIGIGGYLLLMAGAGLAIRELGGSWGSLLQISFAFGMFMILGLVLFSGSARSLLRVWISKHFYSYRYDYREEWLRSIATLSSPERAAPLQTRIIRAVADVVESPAGILWLKDATGAFVPAEYWNVPRFPSMAGTEPPGSIFLERFRDGDWIVRLANEDAPDELNERPAWLANMMRPWLAVPLCHLQQMIGFVVLEQPRAPHALIWENYDLLRTVGRHAASYLAEEGAARALLEAQQFSAFNKKFAFVVHDIKNVVSQLNLIVRNHERHGSNPEFQQDLIETVQHSVGRMNRLLEQLSGELRRSSRAEPISPLELIETAVARLGRNRRVETDLAIDPAMRITVDPDRFRAAFEHLLQNALDASDTDGCITVGARLWQRSLVLEIADEGPGMTPEFIRTELFRPFASTKANGFGIGAYQTREIVRQNGGELHVDSTPGKGTIVRIVLPLAEVGALEPSLAGRTA